MKKVSIIMAVYNEKDSLSQVLERINKVDIGLDKEIIIVDGCSDDGTRDILRSITAPHIKVIFEENRNGKGCAIRRGFAEASGEIILIQDADLETDPACYPNLLKPILDGKASAVYGSRFLNGRGRTNLINYLGNRFVTAAANLLFAQALTDIETCYKVFAAHLLKGEKFVCNGFDFDAELTCALLKKKIKIHEVAISYNPRSKKEGKKLRWRVALPSLAAIIRCRIR